jgi:hypothetical protein
LSNYKAVEIQTDLLPEAIFILTMGRTNGKFGNSLQSGKVVQWTVFENKQLAIGKLAISQTTPSEPTPIEGWIGMHPSHVHANLG